MEDLRQTEEWGRFLAADGWQVEKVKGMSGKEFQVFVRRFPLGVSFIKFQRFDEELDFNSLNQVKNKNRTIYTILEPMNMAATKGLVEAGYRINKAPFLPTKTRIIDLTKSETKLVSEMSENFQRILTKKAAGSWQLAAFRQISADEFYEGWQKWAPAFIFSKNQFMKIVTAFGGKRSEFWAAESGGKLLSALMLLFTADACFYYQTWTSKMGREKSPHVFLVFETMKRAKKLGKKFYNFEGIQDARFPLKNWEGFSEFKRRFGGYEVEYPGSFTKWF